MSDPAPWDDAQYIELGERAYRAVTSQGWQVWAVGLSRCPMCIGLSCADWQAQCDCFWTESHEACGEHEVSDALIFPLESYPDLPF